MNYIGAFVKQLPSGGYKAYIWGQPEGHIMDWNGCNYRRATIPDQPLFGFKTKEEARDFVLLEFKTEKELRKYAYKNIGDGSFLTDKSIEDCLDVRWKKENDGKSEWM